jgi:high-affinity nickel-transport protein
MPAVDGGNRKKGARMAVEAPASPPSAPQHPLARLVGLFTRREWAKLGGLYGFIAFLHVLGWGLFVGVASRYPAFAGAGVLAYTFGLRHAFDADHISAIDDTTRFMLQKGKQPLGVGFFFSLGHSTIVLALSFGLAIAARAVESRIPQWQNLGGTIGASVSGVFLWIIGILNLIVLLGIVGIWRRMKQGTYHREHLEELLLQRGFVNRLLGGRAQRLINHSWQLYPLGLLFGLGFDTASEIGLLALTAGVATGGVSFWAVISLPILFAAGMSLMDTTDGALMSKAYGWAFASPLRKIWYNITTTGLSVAVALLIGTIEIVQVLSGKLGWHGAFFDFLNERIDFGVLGYLIVGMFLAAWLGSVVLWKLRRVEERYGDRLAEAEA